MQMSQIDKDVNADQDSNSETLEIRSTGLQVSNHGERTVMKAKRKLDISHDDEDIPPDKRMKVDNNMTGFQDRGRTCETERRLKSRKRHTVGLLRDKDFDEISSARKSLGAHFKMLKEEIEPFQVANHLKENRIIDDEFYQRFRKLRKRNEKVEALIIEVDLLLSKEKDLCAFTAFKEALDQNHNNIVNMLQERPTSPEVRLGTPFEEDLKLCGFFKKAKDKIIATMEPTQFIDDLVTVLAIDLQQYELITKKDSREERATELYNIASQDYKIMKQLIEYNKELSLEYKKECSTQTLSSNPEATRVTLRYSLSGLQDTQEHSDVKSQIKMIETRIVDSANDNSELGEDILNLTASVLESVKLGSIIFRLRTSGDVSIECLKQCCKNGTAVNWLMSISKPDDIKKLQELKANGGVIECYFDDNDCKKQIFDEVCQECCCVFSRNFIQSHLAEFEGFLRGSELDVINVLLKSGTLDEKLTLALSQIEASATSKDLIQKLIEFLLHSELQQICFCVIEKELRKKKEYNLFKQQQQPFMKCLGEEVDKVTIVKKNIKRSVDLLEEELDGRWFVEILESRGDEACMKILTTIKSGQSRKCCTKPFVRFLCEEEDIGWFIEALYEYSPHAHAILTQSKNPAIECDTRHAMLSVYDFIIDELEPLKLKSCLSNKILEQLNFLQMEKNENRLDRATFFMQQILKNENLEIIQDVMAAMASKYSNIERVIKDVFTKGSLSEHYMCPRVERQKLGMMKTIYKAHFKLPIPIAAGEKNEVDEAGGEKLKKPHDNTLTQQILHSLHDQMKFVGALMRNGLIEGTVFRVGSCYVMTAYHVIQPIIYDDQLNKMVGERLFSKNIFVNFNAAVGDCPRIRAHIKKICYINTQLDVAILKLSTMSGVPAKMLLWKGNSNLNMDKVTVIGYGHPKEPLAKHFEPPCIVIQRGGSEVQAALEYYDLEKENFKLALGNNTEVIDKGYGGIDNANKIFFHGFLEHGASGSPLLVCNDPRSVYVVGMLTNGLPEFFFHLPAGKKGDFPPEHRFHSGSRMQLIYEDLIEVDRNLAEDLF